MTRSGFGKETFETAAFGHVVATAYTQIQDHTWVTVNTAQSEAVITKCTQSYTEFSLDYGNYQNCVFRLGPEVTDSCREEAHHLRIKNFFWFLFVFTYFLKDLKVKIFCLLL